MKMAETTEKGRFLKRILPVINTPFNPYVGIIQIRSSGRSLRFLSAIAAPCKSIFIIKLYTCDKDNIYHSQVIIAHIGKTKNSYFKTSPITRCQGRDFMRIKPRIKV